jgi:hypothetical protein
MPPRFKYRDDFEAEIRILSEAEGGRKTAPRNGIRWDLCYDGDYPNLWMIHPDFLDNNGQSLPESQELPIGVRLRAQMFVLIDQMRTEVHSVASASVRNFRGE